MRSVPSSACLCALLMGVGGSPLESLGWKAPERTVLRARDEGEHAGLWHSVGRGMENADESRWSAAADAWVSADTLRVIKCSALGRRREGATTTLRLPRRTLFCLFFCLVFCGCFPYLFRRPHVRQRVRVFECVLRVPQLILPSQGFRIRLLFRRLLEEASCIFVSPTPTRRY